MSIEFVDKYYEMDPDKEDLLFDGTELKEGMTVLVGEPDLRVLVREGEELSPHDAEMARRYNRWFKVDRVESGGTYTTFVALYADGTKKKMMVPTVMSWIIKINNDGYVYWGDTTKAISEAYDRNFDTAAFGDKQYNAGGNAPTRLYDREELGLGKEDLLHQ